MFYKPAFLISDKMVRKFGMDMYTLLYVKWITARSFYITQGTLLSVCGRLDGRGFWWRIDTCICMAESLCCPPETITALLTGYWSVTKSCLILQPYGLQHSWLSCPSLSPGVCSNSCPLSLWCHLIISSSAAPSPFPASGSFPMSQFCSLHGQGTGASVSASIFKVDFL